MRVALKIVAIVVLLVIMVLAVEALLRTSREAELYELQLRQDQRVLGRALREVGELTWREQGLKVAERTLMAASSEEAEVDVRLLRGEALRGKLEVLTPESASQGGIEHDLVQVSRSGAMITVVPMVGPDDQPIALELTTSRSHGEQMLARGIRRFSVVAILLTLICSVLAVVAGRALIGKRIDILVAQSQALADGRFVRSELTQNDELGELGRALDRTSEQLAAARAALEQETRERERATEQLRWADRLATAGTLAAGLAHELGTPLHVVAGRARRIVHAAALEPNRNDAAIILEQAGQMQQLVHELLDFARPARRERATIDLVSLLRRTGVVLEPLLNRYRATLTIDVGERESAFTQGNPDQLRQVFTNLLVNAAQAMPEGGRIHVSIDVGLQASRPLDSDTEAEPREHVRIRVTDEGVGIEPAMAEQIFDPFFTTKQPGEGTGLGLSIAYGIIRDHKGWMTVHSIEPRGAAVEVWLPQVEPPREETTA